MEVTLKTSEITDAMHALIVAGESPCLIGPSGIGKTQIVEQYAHSQGYECVLVHLMSMSPEDAKFPIVDVVNGTVSWTPAKMFLASKKVKLFFWDELTHANTSMQSMCYQVFEGNRLGDFPLPVDSVHVAAHNRVTDKGVHNRVPMPLRRRWFELNVAPDLDGWKHWALTKGNVHPMIIGYLAWRPAHLYEDTNSDQLAPDPRAWTKLSKVLTINPGLDQRTMLALACGKVGVGVGTEFAAFVRLYQELPDLDSIVASPRTADVPKGNPSAMYAVAAGLSVKMKHGNMAAITQYLDRMSPEFSTFAMKDAITRDHTLTNTPSFLKWAEANKHFILANA